MLITSNSSTKLTELLRLIGHSTEDDAAQPLFIYNF